MPEGGDKAAAPVVLRRLWRARDELVDRVVRERIAIPGYAALDRAQLADLRVSSRRIVDAFLASLTDGRRMEPADLSFARGHVRTRALGGVSEVELLAGLRLFQRVAWEAIVDAAGEDRTAALELAQPLQEFLEAMSQVSSAAFQDVAAALASSRDTVRSRLLDELLAGRRPAPGPLLDELRARGLDGGPLLVVTARPLDPPPDETTMPLVATTFGRLLGDPVEPLSVARASGEVVVVRATADDCAAAFAEAVDAARSRLGADDGPRLAIGISAVHDGPRAAADAYAEACAAAEHVAQDGGLVALPLMQTVDYLVLRAADGTAWRLVQPGIRAFVEEDATQGGELTAALLTYLDSNMNVRLMAQRLHVHPNTAHYRLRKIAQSTGCDMRRPDDLAQLQLAIRLHRALPPPPRSP